MITHRMNSLGKPRCGSASGVVSRSGAPETVTCTACLDLQREPSREDLIATFHRLGAERRAVIRIAGAGLVGGSR